jgi:hypothetical protein
MTIAIRPLCPGCGEPIGAYEPLMRVTPGRGPETTSWLAAGACRSVGETLWHAACALRAGLRSG